MTISRHDRTEVFEEVRVTGGDVLELRRAVEDFLADEARGNQDTATWRVENDSVVMSVRLTSTTTRRE